MINLVILIMHISTSIFMFKIVILLVNEIFIFMDQIIRMCTCMTKCGFERLIIGGYNIELQVSIKKF